MELHFTELHCNQLYCSRTGKNACVLPSEGRPFHKNPAYGRHWIFQCVRGHLMAADLDLDPSTISHEEPKKLLIFCKAIFFDFWAKIANSETNVLSLLCPKESFYDWQISISTLKMGVIRCLNTLFEITSPVINRPGVAGAVLQAPPLLTD